MVINGGADVSTLRKSCVYKWLVRTWGLETLVEPVPGGAVLTAKGRIGRVTAGKFTDALAAARRQAARIVVDLEGVDYVSGPGLAALHEAVSGADVVILCGVSEAVRNTLELAGLTASVQVEGSRQAAINRLRA